MRGLFGSELKAYRKQTNRITNVWKNRQAAAMGQCLTVEGTNIISNENKMSLGVKVWKSSQM